MLAQLTPTTDGTKLAGTYADLAQGLVRGLTW